MILQANAFKIPLADGTIDMAMTSPPYWGQRDYGTGPHQVGMEPRWQDFIEHLILIFQEVKRVLKSEGSLWVNLGDTYAGSGGLREGQTKYRQNKYRDEITRPKQMLPINETFVIRMMEDGWLRRNRITWFKRNGMPTSVTDRFTGKTELVHFFTKQENYYFDLQSVKVPHDPNATRWGGNTMKAPEHRKKMQGMAGALLGEKDRPWRNPAGKNPGDCWDIPTRPFKGVHFAPFPEALCDRPIKAGCPEKVCKKCGKPRERILGNPEKVTTGGSGSKTAEHVGLSPSSAIRTKAWTVYETIGWTDCGCGAGFRPGIILDPFGGTGTVQHVAESLGRKAIILDNNFQYCQLAQRRNAQQKII